MNEADNVRIMLPQLARYVDEIVFVDGNSTDDTVVAARQAVPDVRIFQQTRKGKGNALAVGFAAVRGDIVVMFDVDGSADPAEIPAFVSALTNGADFAKGTRFAGDGAGSTDITPFRKLGNWGLNTIANLLYGTHFTDLCYGYNAFWADLIPVLDLPDVNLPLENVRGDGFEIESMINSRVALSGATIAEVASFEHDRIHGVSNLHPIKDGTRCLQTLWQEHREHRRAVALTANYSPTAVAA